MQHAEERKVRPINTSLQWGARLVLRANSSTVLSRIVNGTVENGSTVLCCRFLTQLKVWALMKEGLTPSSELSFNATTRCNLLSIEAGRAAERFDRFAIFSGDTAFQVFDQPG